MTSWIPMLSSASGRTLTFQAWHDLGVREVAYDLAALLVKPGPDVLRGWPDLKSYLGWSGRLVLQAMLERNATDQYVVVSPFDGGRHVFSKADIEDIILQWQPDEVLLPRGFGDVTALLAASIQPFFAIEDAEHAAPHGVYGLAEALHTNTALAGRSRCAVGVVTHEGLLRLVTQGIERVVSDLPMEHAVSGQVYTLSGAMLSLNDPATADVFEVIDARCACSTCQAGLTQAYLHHLLMHTPLLCQRFLVCHNVSVVLSQ